MRVSPSGPDPRAEPHTWSPTDRVVVRRRVGDAVDATWPATGHGPALADVVGAPEARDDSGWTVRRRDGELAFVPHGAVVAVRRVTGPPLRPVSALGWGTASLERVADLGWPGLERERIGDWVLRAAGGFTGRANSALPLGDPGVPEGDALRRVISWYASRGLPPLLQVPLPLAAPLHARLLAEGWHEHHAGDVLVADLPGTSPAPSGSLPAGTTVEVAPRPTADWLSLYRYRSSDLPPRAVDVLASGARPAFLSLRQEGRPVAIGRVATAEGWAGVTAVEVAPTHRRQGLAGAVMEQLLALAQRDGARRAYLQVAPDNDAAVGLYRKLGFRPHHRYVYLQAA